MKVTIPEEDFSKDVSNINQETIADLVCQYTNAIDSVKQRKNEWDKTKLIIATHLKSITDVFTIGWSVSDTDNNVILQFPASNIGSKSQSLILHNGCLIYLPLVNGFIQVTVIQPYVTEPNGKSAALVNTIIDVCDTNEASDDKRINNHIKRFLKELTRWHEKKPSPAQ